MSDAERSDIARFADVLNVEQRAVWPVLAEMSWECELELLGGTALAMYLRHRASEDFDLFTTEAVDHARAMQILRNSGFIYDPITTRASKLSVILNGVNVSLVKDLPLDSALDNVSRINPPNIIAGMRIGSLEDVIAGKVQALASRKAARDFVDLATIEQRTAYSAVDCLLLHSQRYGFDIAQDFTENLMLTLHDQSLYSDTDSLVGRDQLDDALDYLRGRIRSFLQQLVGSRLNSEFLYRKTDTPTPRTEDDYRTSLQPKPASCSLACDAWMPRAHSRCRLPKGHKGPHRRSI